MSEASKRQDEPDPFTVEPMDFGLPIDEEKAAREIEMRAEIHGSSPKAWLASERHSELNVQRLYGCRHCGTFAYSPPIAHRVESMGLSCGEEEFVLRPHDLVEQYGFLEQELATERANAECIRQHDTAMTKAATRLNEQFDALNKAASEALHELGRNKDIRAANILREALSVSRPKASSPASGPVNPAPDSDWQMAHLSPAEQEARRKAYGWSAETSNQESRSE